MAAATADPKKGCWLPLEANPDVMNDFARRLGLPHSLSFHDVLGLDEELLAFVPRPVLAIMLLFPLPPQEKEEQERPASAAAAGAKEQERGQGKGEGAEASAGPQEAAGSSAGSQEGAATNGPFFLRQTIGNARGTIGLIHAVANLARPISPEKDSFFDKFFRSTETMTPAERGRHLEESKELEAAHSGAASAGDTRPPSADEDCDLHFIALVVKDGLLYELDGRKAAPVAHGSSTPDTLLQDAVKVVKQFMERSPDSLRFNVVALSG